MSEKVDWAFRKANIVLLECTSDKNSRLVIAKALREADRKARVQAWQEVADQCKAYKRNASGPNTVDLIYAYDNCETFCLGLINELEGERLKELEQNV